MLSTNEIGRLLRSLEGIDRSLKQIVKIHEKQNAPINLTQNINSPTEETTDEH